MFYYDDNNLIRIDGRTIVKFLKYITSPFVDAIYCGTEGLMARQARITVIVNTMAVIPALLAMIMAPILFLVYDDFMLLYAPFAEAVILFLVPALNQLRDYNSAKFLVFATHSCGIVFFGMIIGQDANIEVILIWLMGMSFQIFNTRTEKICSWFIILACFAFCFVEFEFSFARTLILSSAIFLNFLVMTIFTRYYQEELNTKSAEYNKVTHEARGVITGMINLSEKWKNLKVGEDGTVSIPVDDISKMRRTILSLSNISNNVLDYEQLAARPAKLERVPIHLPSIFYDVIDTYEALAEHKQVKVELIFDEKSPDVIIGDRSAYKMVISNLLTNAIKFTKPGTSIVIIWRKTGNLLFFNIADCGPGIEKEEQEKIWLPYVSSKHPDFASSGLGLPIIRKTVRERLGGDIQLDSEVNVGSTFSVFIPVEWHESLIRATDIKRKKVMVIDDNWMSLKLVCSQVKELGCYAIQVPVFSLDGYQNLSDLISREIKAVEPDVVIIDNDLEEHGSGINQISILKAKAEFAHIPFILLTGLSIETDEWKKAGAEALLQKTKYTKADLMYYIQSSLSEYA